MKTAVEILQAKDLDLYVTLVPSIDSESPFMDYDEGERAGARAKITSRFNDPDSLYYVVRNDEGLIGYFELHGFKTAKKRHIAYAVCGILKRYYGAGIGNLLSTTALAAASKRWRKIEMSVVEGNEACLKLAGYHGFKKEGFREKSVYMQGAYRGEYLMGLHFDGEA